MNWKYQLLVAAAALSLGACSTDDTCTGPEIGGYKISFTVAEDNGTRTTFDAGDFLRWVPTDEVGIYTVGKNENPNTLTVADVNQHPVEFIGVLKKLVSPGDMFYAYYPYNAAQSDEPSAVTLSIPVEQKQSAAGVYNGESHPLVALPMAFPWERDSKACRMSSVRFRQLGATVELQLYSSNEALRSEKIRSVTFESETPLAGDFPFNLTTVTVDDELKISGYESKTATTSIEEAAVIPATKDEAARIYLTIAPGEYTGQIVVATDVAQYTFSLAKAMTFERAAIMGLPADLAGATREVINLDAPIYFADSEVKRICAENWGNGDGELSYKEAAAVTSIGSIFYRKTILSFNELQYFTGLQSIEENAFSNCSSLTSINIPDGVTSIENYAFSGCSSLTSINIPDGVTEIGSNAFYRCSSLTSINIPDGVTEIGSNAFRSCSSLTSINIPEGVTSIGNSAFEDCSSLTSITIPDKVTSIGTYAFRDCSKLTSINIPDGVTVIGDSAFWGCSSLTSINIPQTVTSFGNYAFTECPSLSAFYGYYASADNRCLIQEGVLLAFAPAGLTEYTIPDGVTTIGNYAFRDCSSLTSISIPDGVTTIGSYAFLNCSSLTSINIPDGVTTIESGTFSGCSSLTSINIPQTVTHIDYQAFISCSSLSNFEGNYASADHRCLIRDGVLLAFAPAGLTEYTIPDEVTTIGDYAFHNCSSLTSISIPDKVTAIGSSAFRVCSSLTSIHIPDGVTKIGATAFVGCSSLTSIHIPDKVTSIESNTFSGCSSLTSINIPDGVTVIGGSAFYNCSSLTSINIPDGVTAIGSKAFYNCSSLTSINIPDGVTKIESYAFRKCSNLTSINIPAGVTAIGYSAFMECSSLTSIDIPDKVTSIERYAFYRCSSLTSVYCKPTTPPTLSHDAFSDTSPSLQIYVPAASVDAYKAAGWPNILADNN